MAKVTVELERGEAISEVLGRWGIMWGESEEVALRLATSRAFNDFSSPEDYGLAWPVEGGAVISYWLHLDRQWHRDLVQVRTQE